MSALKLKELTVIIASSLCLWSVDIASVNAAQFTFINDTNKTATDFHAKLETNGKIHDFNIDFNDIYSNGPIPHGKSYTLNFINSRFISAEWSFEKGDNEPASILVPEPTTIFGSALALCVGGWLKRKKSSQQNKTTSPH